MTNQPDWYAPPKAGAPPHEPTPEPRHAPPPEPAGFTERATARFIDFFVGMGLAFVGAALGRLVFLALADAGVAPANWQERVKGTSVASVMFGLTASLAYHALAEGLGGASIGKATVGLRVKSESLGPCGVGRGIVRNLGYYVDAFFFGAVAYSSMSRSRMKQRVGDKWAGTVVVRAASLSEGAQGSVATGVALGCAAYVAVTLMSIAARML